MIEILIADDDQNLRMLIRRKLEGLYTVVEARDGEEALSIACSRKIDLVISDIMMPSLDGFGLVQALRRRGLSMPILMLTAVRSFDAKREGFIAGTDDYLTKPVNYEELLLRIKALLRRSNACAEARIERGDLVLDSSTYTVSKPGVEIALNNKEFKLLFLLLSSPGRIFTKNQLLDDVWGYDCESSEGTIKTHISRLRNKLDSIGEIAIVAIKGIGYKAEFTREDKI